MAAAGRLLPDVPALQTVDFLNGFNKKTIPFQSRPLLAGRFRTSRHAKPLIFLKLLIRNRYFFSPVRSWPLALGRPGSPNLFRCLCVCVCVWRPVYRLHGTLTLPTRPHAGARRRRWRDWVRCSRDANPRRMANATFFLFFVLASAFHLASLHGLCLFSRSSTFQDVVS